MKNPVSVNMDDVVNTTVQQLGQQLARLSLELNIERAKTEAMRARIEEIEGTDEASDG